ncbi:Sodium/potassium-transporting ATPase subunit alpha, partial [Araneus ventricosus]
MPLFLMVER